MHLKKKAQSVAEFALCLAIISAAIVGMSIYLRRSFQARYRDGANYLVSELGAKGGSQYSNITHQYEPYYRESESRETKLPGSTVILGYPKSSTDVTTQRSGWQYSGAPLNRD